MGSPATSSRQPSGAGLSPTTCWADLEGEGAVARPPVRLEDADVALTLRGVGDRLVSLPLVAEPPFPDLGVRPRQAPPFRPGIRRD